MFFKKKEVVDQKKTSEQDIKITKEEKYKQYAGKTLEEVRNDKA